MCSDIHKTKKRTATTAVLLTMLLVPFVVSCDSDDTDDVKTAGAKAWVEKLNNSNDKAYGNNEDYLVLPGLIADRKHQIVDVYAEATGLGADSPIDILIASPGNDTDGQYTIAFSGARDVQKALEFIGMTAGHPIDFDRMQYWPKGERVTASVSRFGTEGVEPSRPERMEKLIVDSTWSATLPEQDFRFVGISPEADASATDILTAFNSADSVLEVAYVADRRTVSGRLFAKPEGSFAEGQALRIRLRPEFRNGQKRVSDYVLDIQPGKGSDSARLSKLSTVLTDDNATVIVDGDFEGVFVFLKKAIEDGNEPFIAVNYDDAMSAASVRDVARFFQQFLIPQQIRFEPESSQLFYSAFLPDERWRDPQRRQRNSQPIEIHWQHNGGKSFAGAIVQHSMPADGAQVRIRKEFASWTEFEAAMRSGEPWNTDAAFFIVDPEQPYGEMRKVYEQIQGSFPNVYVFM